MAGLSEKDRGRAAGGGSLGRRAAGPPIPKPANPVWKTLAKWLAGFIAACALLYYFLGGESEKEVLQPKFNIRNNDTAPVNPKLLRSTAPRTPSTAPPAPLNSSQSAALPAALQGEPTPQDRENGFKAIFAQLNHNASPALIDQAIKALGQEGPAQEALYTSVHDREGSIYIATAAMKQDGIIKAFACFQGPDQIATSLRHLTAVPENRDQPLNTNNYRVSVSDKITHERKGGGNSWKSGEKLDKYAYQTGCKVAFARLDGVIGSLAGGLNGTGETAAIHTPYIGEPGKSRYKKTLD